MIIRTFFFLFFFLLPFHALGITFLNAYFFTVEAHAPFWLAGWKEILLVLFFLFSGSVFLFYWKKIIRNLDILDFLLFIFSLLALSFGVLYSASFSQAILGIKYDLFFLLIFFIVRHLVLLFPNLFENFVVEKAILFSGIFVLIFAIAQQFLPSDFLVSFGYFSDPSVDTTNKPASFCQLLEGTEVCRLQSTLAGPIRLGAFLVLFSGVLFRLSLSFLVRFGLLFLALWVLFFTYSRAAWIAEFVLLLFITFRSFGISFVSKKVILRMFFSLVFLVFLAFFFIASGKANTILVREGSSSKHWEGVTKSIEILINNPFGIGLGMAGPASTYLLPEQEFLNENWYLQIFTELGFFGGILFMFLCFYALKELYTKDKTMFAIAFSLMVMACFTHVWEESSVAYALWAMIGISLKKVHG